MLIGDALKQGLPCIVVKPDSKKQRCVRIPGADPTPGTHQPRTYTSCREWRRLLIDLKASVAADTAIKIDARDAKRLVAMIKGVQMDQRVVTLERAK